MADNRQRSQADEALRRAVADKRPQESPTPPSEPAARRRFIQGRGW